MKNFKDTKILMFSPYGATKHYGDAIKKELEERGAFVLGYDERPSQGTLSKIVIRLFKKRIPQIFNKYIKKIIALNQNIHFDYILICRGEAFNYQSIMLLRQAYPNAKIILYLWDILKCTDVSDIIEICDKSMSFDPEDVDENKSLIFRPLFYINAYKNTQNISIKENDCIFIGTLHSNRHIVISSLQKSFKAQGIDLYSYLYVPSRMVYIKDLLLKFPYISPNKVYFKPISLDETIELLSKSAAILDINYTNQKSLSSRAFEAMAAERKYITTNPEVKKYDFFNPQNIAVIDLNNPVLPDNFISSPFIPVPDNILKKYSVEGLVDDLFS